MKRYIVAQTCTSGAWRHYLCGWHSNIPAWVGRRESALQLDEQKAQQIADLLTHRYRGVVSHLVEEIAA